MLLNDPCSSQVNTSLELTACIEASLTGPSHEVTSNPALLMPRLTPSLLAFGFDRPPTSRSVKVSAYGSTPPMRHIARQPGRTRLPLLAMPSDLPNVPLSPPQYDDRPSVKTNWMALTPPPVGSLAMAMLFIP